MQVNGVKILPETIRVMDPDEKDITEAVKITTTDTSYQIDTGMDLAYNESFTVTYDVTFVEESLAGQQVVNIAKAKADNAQAETENDVTPIITEDGLEVVKSADPVSGTTVKAGDTITYDITVTNTGSAEKENILVLDAIPALTTYVEGSGGNLVTIGEKQYVSFVVDSIPAGETADVSFQVTVNADATEDDTIKVSGFNFSTEYLIDGDTPDESDFTAAKQGRKFCLKPDGAGKSQSRCFLQL